MPGNVPIYSPQEPFKEILLPNPISKQKSKSSNLKFLKILVEK